MARSASSTGRRPQPEKGSSSIKVTVSSVTNPAYPESVGCRAIGPRIHPEFMRSIITYRQATAASIHRESERSPTAADSTLYRPSPLHHHKIVEIGRFLLMEV